MDENMPSSLDVESPVALDKHSLGTFTARGTEVRITVKNLTFSVPHMKKRNVQAHLLKNISIFFNPSEMSALMGPSGSGKTTLLDLLAGRKTTGRTEGQILFGGLPPSKQYLRRFTGYVEQFDSLLPILTVREMLMYTAELKRPLSETPESKKADVDALIGALALDVCRNTLIGSYEKRGISGGQAKRTNIGIALVTNPRVLFLDEPTTGLDSYTSNEVMDVVKKLTQQTGVTVCSTIHSPTAYCFNLFDRVTLLVSGNLVYFGQQGAIIMFFTTYSSNLKEFTPGYNNAEYITDLVTEADRMGKALELAEAYAISPFSSENQVMVDSYAASDSKNVSQDLLAELNVSRSTVTPMWWGLRTFMAYRTSKNFWDPSFVAPRVVPNLVIGLLILTLYLNIGTDNSDSNVTNIAAVLFMWSATPGFVASGYMPTLFLERSLFVRERNDGLYLVLTYLLAKLFEELMINSISSLCVGAMVFYAIKLNGSFGLFYVSYLVAVSVGIILAYFVSSISPSM
ncbi:hypothetical protein CEUSTIGMA_g860.t1 [Chlamydomonas eustigma]|uniref:ABC transporter domain-containing protein n=1 Tax=Chlamydomonas eustigma TaxID=1157962 RepID=A0A250WRF5_9CHLO|nr:hypothetical protein CEUSTIGMA_g860.t1 [Chlamydomonas eustigma]|eukprot:GAX73408.1 hypothetical protein CEUSTIGMA_g860.t1 [Chlamydomonas eustigma]